MCVCVCVCVFVAHGETAETGESVGSECVGRWCNVIAHPPLRRSNGPVPCVSGVLSQHVAACRVETTLRGVVVVGAAYRVGWLAGWLAGGGSVRWGG